MSLLCSYCHKEITEAPIAAIHLGCAPKVMELAATDNQQLKVSIAQVEANQAHFYKYKYIGRATWPQIVRALKDLAQQATV